SFDRAAKWIFRPRQRADRNRIDMTRQKKRSTIPAAFSARGNVGSIGIVASGDEERMLLQAGHLIEGIRDGITIEVRQETSNIFLTSAFAADGRSILGWNANDILKDLDQAVRVLLDVSGEFVLNCGQFHLNASPLH